MMLIFKYFLIKYNIKNMCDYSENNINCCKKKSYGEFCNKHKRNHLVKNDLIIFDRFTYKSSDYLKGDILNTINNLASYPEHKKTLKKGILYPILLEKFNKLNHYNDHIKSIKYIQLNYKKKYDKLNELIRGEGFINKKLCNNNEDFFTYETYDEIDDKYFFSYKDNTGIIWFFDIRSLKKLIDMRQCNPYTMKPFNIITIIKANKLIEYLKNNNIRVDFKDEMKKVEKDKKTILKHKMIDIFAIIERLGFSFNNEWFTSLHTISLKKLYYLMEDIWNYRSQLSLDMKISICPPNGIIFNKSPFEIRGINNRDILRNIIIDDISKFNNAISDGDKKTGFMYFLIGLAKINPIVCDTHPWILNI